MRSLHYLSVPYDDDDDDDDDDDNGNNVSLISFLHDNNDKYNCPT